VIVACTPGLSLREAIVNDPQLAAHGFAVPLQQKPGRPRGWAKLRSTAEDRRGALNLEWDADALLLIGRVVNRGGTRPNRLLGDFVEYLLARRRSRIRSIQIVPPRGAPPRRRTRRRRR
jgi:hypothetical protein